MQLVNLCPGINVRPDQVSLVIAQKNTDRATGGFVTNVCSEHHATVGIMFDTAEEAEQCADDWTRKINATTVGPMVPNQDLDEKATVVLDQILAELRETSCAIQEDLDDMIPSVYLDMKKRLHAMILKHLGGEA